MAAENADRPEREQDDGRISAGSLGIMGVDSGPSESDRKLVNNDSDICPGGSPGKSFYSGALPRRTGCFWRIRML